jgi:hypothetical protein
LVNHGCWDFIGLFDRLNQGGNKFCGRVGGTNGAKMRCDGLSRAIIHDVDGTAFGDGEYKTLLSTKQSWYY